MRGRPPARRVGNRLPCRLPPPRTARERARDRPAMSCWPLRTPLRLAAGRSSWRPSGSAHPDRFSAPRSWPAPHRILQAALGRPPAGEPRRPAEARRRRAARRSVPIEEGAPADRGPAQSIRGIVTLGFSGPEPAYLTASQNAPPCRSTPSIRGRSHSDCRATPELGMRAHIPSRQCRLEPRAARHQVRREQVLLRVVTVIPLRGIVVRQVDVVHPDERARRQRGQHLEEEHGCVGVRERAMRAVEEDHVAWLELAEHVEVAGLEGLAVDVGRTARRPRRGAADRSRRLPCSGLRRAWREPRTW